MKYWDDEGSLPVELSTFTAQFLNNIPTLYWVTQSETDNIGWYVYRNTKDDFEDANRISGFIEGYGTTTEPHNYIYYDEDLEPISGNRYWYWIQNINFGGHLEKFGPQIITIPDISHPDPYQNIPKQYGLHPGLPNPFGEGSSSTKVSFMLHNTSNTELKVYNIHGKLIKNLYNGVAYGDNEVNVNWDGKDEYGIEQSTGIYLLQLNVNGKPFETKKVILIR